jgi:lycopene beta-cyclase
MEDAVIHIRNRLQFTGTWPICSEPRGDILVKVLMSVQKADIVIAGAGLAGLTMAVEMAARPFFDQFRIVLVEKDSKTANDRTWCFWATPDEPLPPVISRSWQGAHFFGLNGFERRLGIRPYTYNMVRSSDFYGWARAIIQQKTNMEWVEADISSIDCTAGQVHTSKGVFEGNFVFNSAIRDFIDRKSDDARFTRLLQHFKGWIIETDTPAFDPHAVTFMDYRIEQGADTRFVYVLPFSDKKALVEYTVFSPELLPDEVYDRELSAYISQKLNITDFRITETEFGVIPMTDLPVRNREGRTFHIGTAGGFVKGSSGYAFKRTQRKTVDFLNGWVSSGAPDESLLRSKWRYRFYDSVLLRVLNNGLVPGSRFFTMLFSKLPATLVFRFLDEDSTFAEDLRLLSAPPTLPFTRAAFLQIPAFHQI